MVVGANFMVDADARLEAALSGMDADGGGNSMPGMAGMDHSKQ